MRGPSTLATSTLSLALPAALALGCGGDDGAAATTTSTTTTTDATTGDTDTGAGLAPAAPPSPICAQAPTLALGRHQGTLRGVAFGGPLAPCDEGGPRVYLRVEIPIDADLNLAPAGGGFVARSAALADVCPPDITLGCADDGPLIVRDLPAGSAVLVAISAAPDDPALATPPPADGLDPLAFTVDIALTRVLGLGDACGPAIAGRCPAGALCLADAADPGGPTTCQALAADTCATAELLLIDAQAGARLIDPSAPHTDAHAHACTGAGVRERVLRIALDPALPPASDLELVVKRGGVGLAARAPGCALTDAIACEPPGEDGVVLSLADPAAWIGALGPYLFLELSDAVVEPFELTWTLTPAG
jgi:hypothetical protein